MLPAWFAAIMHVPAVMPVTVMPLTVHTSAVVLVNIISRLEVAVAFTVVFPPAVRTAGLKLIFSMV